jgi:formylglycine-generating enzyme required for sulfatase activity
VIAVSYTGSSQVVRVSGYFHLQFKRRSAVQDISDAQNPELKTRIFISYSRKDMAFADRLEAALRAREFEVLIDRQEIYAFEDWWGRIETLIGQADTVVFVLSPDAVKSNVALKEAAHAASLNKRFAPIVCRPVEDSAVPEALTRLNFIFFDDPESFDASADKLADALRTDIGWIRQHTEYGEAERRWRAAGRPNGLLLQSPTLDLAEYWLISRPRNAPEPTQQIRSYVLASRKRARMSQRVWRLVLASTFTFMTATTLGLLGWINQATIADEWRFITITWPYARANVRPYVLSTANEQALKPGDSFKECPQGCPEMVVVPSGSFEMGSPQIERQAYKSEKGEFPQHLVTIAKPFAISKYELTFAEWDTCVTGGGCHGYKPNDQGWGGGQQPVINVDWYDAQAYVAWLSQVTGKTYRLLSEAEYEYAARAGTTTAYAWGADIEPNGQAMANCDGCGSKWDNQQTAPVGSFPPNRFGLYDMEGNVWEWTEDCVHNDYYGAPPDASAWIAGGDCSNRAVRGGAWDYAPGDARSAFRSLGPANGRDYDWGFRVARTLVGP